MHMVMHIVARMQVAGPDHLLFIHPTSPASSTPVIDSLTRRAAAAWRRRLSSPIRYRGRHDCTAPSCLAHSDNGVHWVASAGGGILATNSMLVHYLAFHREDVPAEELAKVLTLPVDEVEPTARELGTAATPPSDREAKDARARYDAFVAANGRQALPGDR